MSEVGVWKLGEQLRKLHGVASFFQRPEFPDQLHGTDASQIARRYELVQPRAEERAFKVNGIGRVEDIDRLMVTVCIGEKM